MPYQDPPSYGSQDGLGKGSKSAHGQQPGPAPNGQGHFDYTNAPKYPDLWATILYLVNTLGFIILSGVSINFLVNHPPQTQPPPPSNPGQPPPPPPPTDAERNALIGVLVGYTVLAAVLSGLYVAIMRKFPKQLIHFTFIASVALTFALAAFFAYQAIWLACVIYFIFGIIFLICYIFWRKYIPFTAAILETVVEIGDKYPASYLFAFLSLVIGLVYQVWWLATVVGTAGKFQSTPGAMDILYVYLVFTFYWTGQILTNTLHVTVAGTVASYFFLEGTSAMPASPTLAAAKRAFTTSFGPIAFGSLLIAILKTIKYLLDQAARDGSIVALILSCFVSCIAGLVEYFNEYAYIQVAIYGKPFCTAAKDTWNLIKSTGFEMIINDSFVGRVIGIGSILLGLIVGGAGYLTMLAVFSSAQMTNLQGYVVGLSIILFFVGILMMGIIGMYIQSAVQTMYVCLAEDPSALARTKPQLYERFKQTYPSYHWRF